MVTIDHVTKCEVDPDAAVNELVALSCLSAGLHQLYASVELIETPLRERDEKNSRTTSVFGGTFRGFRKALPSFYHASFIGTAHR